MRKILKTQRFDLENEGQAEGREKRDLCHSIVNVRIYVADFFRMCYLLKKNENERKYQIYTQR